MDETQQRSVHDADGVTVDGASNGTGGALRSVRNEIDDKNRRYG